MLKNLVVLEAASISSHTHVPNCSRFFIGIPPHPKVHSVPLPLNVYIGAFQKYIKHILAFLYYPTWLIPRYSVLKKKFGKKFMTAGSLILKTMLSVQMCETPPSKPLHKSYQGLESIAKLEWKWIRVFDRFDSPGQPERLYVKNYVACCPGSGNVGYNTVVRCKHLSSTPQPSLLSSPL